ncbi:MAG: glycogen synthase GlgA [Halanaerobium sp.]
MEKKKVLFVTSEAAPFVKTGGLGDVAGSLPAAMREKGHDVRVVLPEYRQLSSIYKEQLKHVTHFRTNITWRNEYVGVNKLNYNNVPFYFIDNKKYFDRSNLYDNPDRHLQFILFMRGALEMLPQIDFKPDIIHCNDWQTALIPLFLNDNYKKYNFYKDIKTVFTIHNLRYQGIFGPEIITDSLGVDPSHFYGGNIRHDGLVNFMKAGIMYSDKITTVSKTYVSEIKTPYFGEGLDYALRMRGDDLEGIVNGISFEENDPSTDKELFANFDRNNFEGKAKNRRALQSFLGLEINPDKRILSIITRLVEQKGIDLIKHVAEEIVKTGLQFVILGTGNPEYEDFFRNLARRYPDQVAAEIKYDFTLAKRIYASSDFFLMPSQFEPCGLGQLFAMRYGTVPIVRETGGLKDTVEPYNNGEGTGFTFKEYNAHKMLKAIEDAADLASKPDQLETLQKRVMDKDFSWDKSAEKYLNLYDGLIIDSDSRKSVIEKDSKIKAEKEIQESIKEKKSGELNKVNINLADRKELEQVKGIGPAYARRIVAYREENGEFSDLKGLLNINGIGPARLKSIKSEIYL